MLPDEESNKTDNENDGSIDFVAPETEHLQIIKIADCEPVNRPNIIFSDELIPQFELGMTDIRVELTHLVMLQQAAIALLAQAKREVFIMTPDLEHERFDNDAFCEALSAFARSSRYTQTKILIANPQLAIEDGHRVIKLIRRISSLIEIRQLHEHDIEHNQAMLIADSMGLLRCTNRDPWQGSLLPKGTPYAQQMRDYFVECWERAEDINDFRELKI
ncbi:MAG: hypothetical protein KDI39_12845 [Pseudomonadales bacterium]|nr:hypothetical protein [Pseudomonadales bacterium]